MTIELSEFYQTFFEEASEHLATMESLLLNVNVEAPNLDDLNAIFRSAHSIKGGAGMFGFNEITDVTHILETLLDRLRKKELRLTEAMVDAFLQAADIVKSQIEARQGGPAVSPAAVETICATLRQLTEAPKAAAPPAARPAGGESLEIRFSREGNPLGDLAPFDFLVDNLKALGELTIVDDGETAGSKALLRLKLKPKASESEIREAFAFFVQPDQVDIAAGAQAAAPAPVPVPTPAEKAEREEAYGFFVEPAPVAAQAAPEPPSPPKPAPAVKPAAETEPKAPPAPGPVAKAEEKAAAKSAAAPADASIRVNVEKVDQLINLAGELVITQAMLAQTVSLLGAAAPENLLNGIAQLERNTRDLQEAVMSIRMIPMSFVFSRFPRMVRDIAAKLGKEVNFKTQGESVELDKGLIEKITDPLTHLVRNSLDHGIETAAARREKGKDPKGNLTLRAYHQGGSVVIQVQDDGAGLNRERILAKARERGLPVADNMSDQDVWMLIFAPGFSTADVVTDVSGRGVGMDVVKKNIESLGGRTEIESTQGQGTVITIRLPLTLAILDGLSIAVGEETYIIPLTSIVESLQPRAEDVKTVAGQGRVVHVRGEYLNIIALHEVFGVEPRHYEVHKSTLMIVEADGARAALMVDELMGQHQVVIKSLESNYRRVPGVSGATIMGDGRVALILDIAGVIRLGKTLVQRFVPPAKAQAQQSAGSAPKSDGGNASFRLENAVNSHLEWKNRLLMFLDGKGENLDSEKISRDNLCELGKWIYGAGARYKSLAEYRELRETHGHFHRRAGEVVEKFVRGDKTGALNMLKSGGAYSVASGKTVEAILNLKSTVENRA
jgi:two-component system chemotaxis sensor kinase CheA